MNSELTATFPNLPNVCRDFWALAYQAMMSEGQDEFGATMEVRTDNSISQNLSFNPRAAKGVHHGVEPLSVVQRSMRGGVQVL